MLRPATTIADKMIKVDHAGENGAVNIYRAQAIVSRWLRPGMLPLLLENQRHEEQHRALFAAHLAARNIRRCVSYRLCGLGGFVLGFVTAWAGEKAIHATTYAVEHVVLAHLAEQMAYLRDVDGDALACVAQIHADEQAHHDAAEAGIGYRDWRTKILIAIVRLCTEGVIRFGMR
jgi:3-demethoxyubiquinol 3-hydroxylase